MIYTHTERIGTSYPAWFYFMLCIYMIFIISQNIFVYLLRKCYTIFLIWNICMLGRSSGWVMRWKKRLNWPKELETGVTRSCINGLVAYFLICNIFYRDILFPPPDLQIWKFYVYFWTSLCVAVRKMWYKLNQWCNV